MSTVLPATAKTRRVPPLENGDHLEATEFLRRYEAMPEVKKAELIQGIVQMASPVRYDQHGKPDSLMRGWLMTYAARHAGAHSAANTTLRLGPEDVVQPDGMLFRDRADGGGAWVGEDGYLTGCPELVVEIAASSVSRDAWEKRETYQRAGIPEYLLWRVEDEVIEWFCLEDGLYRAQKADGDGLVESRAFAGLRLDVGAALRFDAAAVLAALG